MSRNPFDPVAEDLPARLPIFPLGQALLLPRGRLPLNIFEPRYVNMTLDALAGGRMIGMVLPDPSADEATEPGSGPTYRVGCAGRIVSFAETEDGRLLIALRGVCRFQIADELAPISGYRRVTPDWTPFVGDLSPAADGAFDRDHMLARLRTYTEMHGLSVDPDVVARTTDEELVAALAMLCPFTDAEKQVLMESATLAERARSLLTLLEMAILDKREADVDGPDQRH